MASVKFKFNPKGVLEGNKNFLRNNAAKIDQAMALTGMRIAHDAVIEEPRPPIDWGVLRGSVNIVTQESAQDFGAASAASRKRPPSAKKGEVIDVVNRDGLKRFAVRVSFRTRYAKRLHETDEGAAMSWPSKDIDAGVGPKYLSSKIDRNGPKYNTLCAGFMRQVGLG